LAQELSISCCVDGDQPDATAQAISLYRALARCVADKGGTPANIVSEVVFLRDIRRDLVAVLAARDRALADVGPGGHAPAPAVIEQPPVEPGGTLAVLAHVILPHDPAAAITRDLHPESGCPCAGCAAGGGRTIQLGSQTALHSANLYGRGQDTYAQALEMFRVAERLLASCGMDTRDIVRTWIQLRDIDRDYDALNRARRAFFAERGIDPRPASTGVQGGPFPDEHAVALRIEALHGPEPRQIAVMSTPLLNEAWSYGADFSRGLRVVEANKITLHISGTASVDEAGRSAHGGHFVEQADRMLANIASLLAQHGASPAQIVSAVTYMKHPGDAPALRAQLRAHGFEGFPHAVVHAPLCRPELLCETEAMAILPLAAGTA
jgi:enamine deaminase RidA (YjgF/YER057c/UK114 family)